LVVNVIGADPGVIARVRSPESPKSLYNEKFRYVVAALCVINGTGP
jgi:hypothetical protein